MYCRYIERFRKAPPTPREGRGREDQAGPDREFWWQQQSPRSPSGGPSPNSDPSPARSNSTPDSASTPESTLAQVRGISDKREAEVTQTHTHTHKQLTHCLLCCNFVMCTRVLGGRCEDVLHAGQWVTTLQRGNSVSPFGTFTNFPEVGETLLNHRV